MEESPRGDAVRIELYCPDAAQPGGESSLPPALAPLSVLPRAQPATAPLHLLAAAQAAMIQGDMSLVESALDVWWANMTEQSALPVTWRMQLLRAAMLAVRHAERHGGTVEDIFAQELDSLFALRSIVSPSQGRELLLRMFRRSVQQASKPAGPFLHPLVRDTMAIVNRDLSRKLTLHEIADKLGVDPSYLSRLFSQTGQSYTDYALQARMERAKQLLEDGRKVHEAASMTGYKDTAHFSRNFSKYWGQPPIRFK
jgi:two-component system response regulator YesN